MLGWIRWQLAKRRFLASVGTQPSFPLRHELCDRRVEDFPPNTAGYARLAALWNDFSACFTPDYASFLIAAGARYGQPVESVLDLACGTGVLARQLAARAKRVVGLDASADMLREARARTPDGSVRFVLGDFCDCQPGETFDAAVCGSDSLNYLERPEQLATVFRSVRRVLRPGGLFAFDALGGAGFLARCGVRTEVELGGQRWEHYRFYDPATRVCEDRLVFADAIEGHRRVAIDKGDVLRAAREEGVSLEEHLRHPGRDFYLVRMPRG
jgi:SAM-dependent methyltransferase